MTEKEDPMKVYSLMLGSYQTNCYLAADDDGVCAVIDPGGEAGRIRTRWRTPAASLRDLSHPWTLRSYRRATNVRAYWPEIPVYLNRRDRYEGDAYWPSALPRPCPGESGTT